MKLTATQKKLLYEFMTRFYDICDTPESDCWSVDEFYSEFSGRFHEKMIELMNNMEKTPDEPQRFHKIQPDNRDFISTNAKNTTKSCKRAKQV
jgi:hypothetical protein